MTRKFSPRLALPAIFLTLLLAAVLFAQTPAPLNVIEVPNPANSAAQQKKPYVVLVSLDGFRYDYPRIYSAPNLTALAKRGASAPEGMYPPYPSLTFPSHYAEVTGLYPEHSGIVANSFYDPARKERYGYGDRKTTIDGTWYSGVPLWSLAEKNGMRAACFFWPGSEAEIAGKRPSYYLAFDGTLPDDRRVEQVLAWLRLPADKRPHFITLYMSETDGAGHQFGPNSPQVATAVSFVDAEVGKLVAGIDALHLPVNIIVTADHGMAATEGGWITLDQFADLSHFETVGPLLYPHTPADAASAYQSLKREGDKSGKFKVYRRADVPAKYHYNSNDRIGDPVVIASGPYAIRAHAPSAASGQPDNPPPLGQHGYDPWAMVTMRALFVAAGPDFKPGATLPPFDNVDVYPLIADILSLPVGKIDGSLTPVESALAHQPVTK
jgi:predicted AlkP superfamily pyrophosphatase or phosphodiesterase